MTESRNLFLTPETWDRLATEHWGRRPGAFSGVFSQPLLAEAELLAALRPLGERWRALPAGALPGSDHRDLCYFAGDTPAVPVEGIDPFPLEGETDLAAYYRRVRELIGNDYLLVGYDLQAYSPVLWERILGFLRPLMDRVGHPPHFTRCDTFLGKYTSTPVGVHLDSAHVFTFVLSGRKRIHLWPREFVAEAPDLPGALTAKTYGKYLDRAITIEATPDDLLYWPYTYWHIAENDELSATVTVMWEQHDLRLPQDPCIPRWLAGVVSEQAGRASPRTSVPIQDALDRFVATQDDPGYRDFLWTQWLERASKLSFPETPHVPAPAVDPAAAYRANPPVLLEWTRLDTGELLCAANGGSFRIAWSEAAERLLARLGAPERWTLAELRRDHAPLGDVVPEVVGHCLRLRAVVPEAA